jgi:hypothetical protein
MNRDDIQVGDLVVGRDPDMSRGIVIRRIHKNAFHIYWFLSTHGYPYEEENTKSSLERCMKCARENGYPV